MRFRLLWALVLAASLSSYTADITPVRRAALDHISAQSLRGHVSFLASDLLEGRDTPSQGLDIAAEYIAAQFRRAGLKPAGDDGYFQTAHFLLDEESAEGAEVEIQAGKLELKVARDDLRVTGAKADFSGAALVKVNPRGATAEQVEGKVVVFTSERPVNRAPAALIRLKPAAVVIALSGATLRTPEISSRLFDPQQVSASPPVMRVYNSDFYKYARDAKPGSADARISAHLPAPQGKPVTLRNVAGILPGSDPALAGSYVLVTAHYDHLGKAAEGDGDVIFNGANDDASGVASVIELASALSAGAAPRRSILFMAFFGEERGLLGSRYYARHPLVPIAQTVADLNLEQLGRSDGDVAPGTLTMTGFHFSDLSTALKLAGAATGVKISDPGKAGDDYFSHSDNLSLADVGVPSHSIATAFEFPDYHRVGDEWQKLDYANLEKVDRTIALAILMVADAEAPPKWSGARGAGR